MMKKEFSKISNNGIKSYIQFVSDDEETIYEEYENKNIGLDDFPEYAFVKEVQKNENYDIIFQEKCYKKYDEEYCICGLDFDEIRTYNMYGVKYTKYITIED